MTKKTTKFVMGFRPVVHAREGLMLGIRQLLDGPVFERLEHAEYWCFHVMVDHNDRRLGLSDALIVPFKGMVACGPPLDPALLRDVRCICEQVAREPGL